MRKTSNNNKQSIANELFIYFINKLKTRKL